MTNFYKYASAKFQNRSFDPGNTYGMPWASGSTGIAWNPKYIKDPISSINDLWNPKYAGHVGMMADIQEIGNFGLYKIGVAPEKSTPADWQKAADALKAQKAAGIVRQYYDQSYINALAKGDTWITMAWSGDIFQQNLSSGTDLQFVVPKEGGNIWTDNMTIPKYAQNPVDAMMLMDWYYRPDIAAKLTEAIEYISAVPAVQSIISADAAKATGSSKKTLQEVATSPLVWLTAADYARLHNYVNVTGKAQQTVLVHLRARGLGVAGGQVQGQARPVPADPAGRAVADGVLRDAADLPALDVDPDRERDQRLHGDVALRGVPARPAELRTAVPALAVLRRGGDGGVHPALVPDRVLDRVQGRGAKVDLSLSDPAAVLRLVRAAGRFPGSTSWPTTASCSGR